MRSSASIHWIAAAQLPAPLKVGGRDYLKVSGGLHHRGDEIICLQKAREVVPAISRVDENGLGNRDTVTLREEEHGFPDERSPEMDV